MSLSDKYSHLLGPTLSKSYDDDEGDSETNAKLIDHEDFGTISLENNVKIIKKTNSLNNEDIKYAGKKINRSNYFMDESNNIEDDVEDENSDEMDTDTDDLENSIKDNEVNPDISYESPKYEEKPIVNDESHETASNIKLSTDSFDISKGYAVLNQITLYDKILGIRIRLQKLLQNSNQLPHFEKFNQLFNNSTPELQKNFKKASSKLKILELKLLKLQSSLINSNPETRFINTGEITDNFESENEEITSSDSETETSDKKIIEKNKFNKNLNVSEHLNKFHERFTQYQNKQLEKWHDRTKLLGGRNLRTLAALETSITSQIRFSLTDMKRLRSRSNIRRSNYKILLDEELDSNVEIFDDDDFYHQLLRELIERKTENINDPIALSRHWLELQKMKSKIKKNYSRRTNKDRQIKFLIHPKLVNFTAPVINNNWTNQAKDELFSSLFGARHENNVIDISLFR